jgi:hypothetical protein
MGRPALLRLSFTAAALRQGRLPRILLFGADADQRAALERALKAGGESVAVVGPPLSLDWQSYVPSHPGTRFVLVAVPAPRDGAPANATFLAFDARERFREAGRRAARALADRPASAPAGGLAVLLASPSDLSAEEVDSFRDGAAGELGGARPAVRRLEPMADAAAARAALQDLKGGGADIFLLGLGAQDADGLDELRARGGRAVVADWSGTGACPAQVLLSVDDDLAGSIGGALAAAARAQKEAVGAARLRRGGAKGG